MVREGVPQPTTVQLRRRQVTIDALIEAAERGMIEYGVDVSMDDIAAMADVARRTAFRYFATREDLLSAAMRTASADYLRSLPRYEEGDWRDWLAEFALVMHRATARIGRLYWEFTTKRLPERMMQAHAEHRQALGELYGDVAATIWRAAGADGAPPEQLRRTTSAHLSPLFTQAVMFDAAGTADLAADMAIDIIVTTVEHLLGRNREA